MTRERWYTIGESAERIGKTPRTIYSWISSGFLRPVAGRIPESQLVRAEQAMRARRGRPRKPRDNGS